MDYLYTHIFIIFSAAKVVSYGYLPTNQTIDDWRKNAYSAPIPLKFNLQPISNLFQQDWLDGISLVPLNATQLTKYFEESLNVIYYCLIMIRENCILSCSTPGICPNNTRCAPVAPSDDYPFGFQCEDDTTSDEI